MRPNLKKRRVLYPAPRLEKSKRCGKTRFKCEIDALIAASRCVQPGGQFEGTKLRVYRCPSCGGWHLSSKYFK
jgi:hypothetical protein